MIFTPHSGDLYLKVEKFSQVAPTELALFFIDCLLQTGRAYGAQDGGIQMF